MSYNSFPGYFKPYWGTVLKTQTKQTKFPLIHISSKGIYI